MLGPNDNISEEKKEVETTTEPTETPTIEIGELSDIDRINIAETLGFDKFSDFKKYQDDIKYLYEYAKLKGAKGIDDVNLAIRELKSKLGGVSNDVSSLKKLSRYAYLSNEQAKLNSEMERIKAT